MSTPETQQEPHRIKIEKLVYGGDALSRINGQTVFVPFALPGEEIELETVAGRAKILRGINPRILDPSPHRVQPPCEYFGRCGGCHYQHADYEYQVSQKVSILRETLARLGKLTFEQDVPAITGQPFGYRNRIKLHIDRGKMGYRQADSHKLCPIARCPISSPKLNEVIAILNQMIKQKEWPSFVSGLEVFTNETDVQLHITETSRPVASRFFTWCSELIGGFQPDSIEYESSGRVFRVSRGTFFQVNRFLIGPLVQEVVSNYEGQSAIDLYAGAGLFALPLAEHFQSLVAVERSASAYRDLIHNAESANSRISAVKASTDEFLEQLTAMPDLVVADPPRTGLTREVATSLLRVRPQKIVIVSCDPATLARDLETMLQSYSIRAMKLFDLFPQTFHFETVVHLELKR